MLGSATDGPGDGSDARHDDRVQSGAVRPASALLSCERAVLGAVVRKGMRILDLGVQPEVTVAAMSAKAFAHAGGDYCGLATDAKALARCRELFPDLTFEEGDGADLARFGSSSFDAVVFARNGLARL